jgi:hypothetical protein
MVGKASDSVRFPPNRAQALQNASPSPGEPPSVTLTTSAPAHTLLKASVSSPGCATSMSVDAERSIAHHPFVNTDLARSAAQVHQWLEREEPLLIFT